MATAQSSSRVVAHLDMDCFYAQVERKRLGIPPEVPLAVQQWEGLIAINYPARAAGVTRHMRVKQAREICPALRTVHVQTIGGERPEAEEYDPAEGSSDRLQQKACLERYRRACAEIIALIHRVVPQVPVEKASIDEVYIDVTALVDQELQERASAQGPAPAAAGMPGPPAGTPAQQRLNSLSVVDAFAWGSCVVGGPLDPGSEFERRLSVGAGIVCRVRGAIKAELDFTCSAGIASNKLLAKVASAMNKPNRQTIVPPRSVPQLMENLPLKKLRSFGGKLGALLEGLGASTAGEVAALDPALLSQHFGQERAAWIARAVRGASDEPVTERELAKSMLAAKSFEAIRDPAQVRRWLAILAEELADRLTTDQLAHARRPKAFSLSYSSLVGGGGGKSKSQQAPVRWPQGGPSADLLLEQALELFHKIPDPYPLIRLAFSAEQFVPLPLSEKEGAITRFFGAASAPAGEAAAACPAPPPPPPAAPAAAARRGPTAGQGQPSIQSMLKRQPAGSQAAPAPQQAPAPAAAGKAQSKLFAPLPGGQQQGPGQPGAQAAAPDEEQLGAGGCGEAAQLEGVDVEEQKRILRDIWVAQQLSKTREGDSGRKRPGGQEPAGMRQRKGSRGVPAAGSRQSKLSF